MHSIYILIKTILKPGNKVSRQSEQVKNRPFERGCR